jgi:hypothetical protein
MASQHLNLYGYSPACMSVLGPGIKDMILPPWVETKNMSRWLPALMERKYLFYTQNKQKYKQWYNKQ